MVFWLQEGSGHGHACSGVVQAYDPQAALCMPVLCRFLRVVKLTLLGSVIGNLLLVMGSAFIAGGVLHPSQSFNQQGINVNCGLLILSGGLETGPCG